MRIALIQTVFHTNTAGIVIGLASRGHDVLPISQYPISSASATPITGIEPVIIPYGQRSLRRWGLKGSYRPGFPQLRPLIRTLRDFRPDVVIARDIRVVSAVSFVIAKLLGATPILWLLKSKWGRIPRGLRAASALLLPRRRFHTGRHGLRGLSTSLGRGLGSSQQLLLPLPFGHPIVPESLPEAPTSDRIRVIVVSSLTNPLKRLDWIPRALAAEGLGDQTSVTIVGHADLADPEVEALRRLFRDLGVSDPEIRLNLSTTDVLGLMRAHHVLVHPSRKEEYGAVIPEAMSQGLPVLCGNACSAMACFTDEESGLVFEHDSFEHFRSQLRRIVTDPGLRNRLRRAAHQEALANLMPDVWASRFEDLVATSPPRLWGKFSA